MVDIQERIRAFLTGQRVADRSPAEQAAAELLFAAFAEIGQLRQAARAHDETDEDLIRELEEDTHAFSLDGDDGRSEP